MAAEDSTTRLIAYGSLAPGRPNHHLLKPLQGSWSQVTLRGTLLIRGWGARIGYPGLVLDPNGEEIRAHLLESPGLAAYWPTLDAFEGEEYQRQVTCAQRDDGEIVLANVYVLNRANAGPSAQAR